MIKKLLDTFKESGPADSLSSPVTDVNQIPGVVIPLTQEEAAVRQLAKLRRIDPGLIQLIDARLEKNGLAQEAINKRDARLLLQLVCECLVGIREKGGNNKGREVELFQKTIGRSEGEAWCMGFVQSCIAYVERKISVASRIYPSEHCMTVWVRSPKILRVKFHPLPGAICIWNYIGSQSGHTGIVKVADAISRKMILVEGNTEAGIIGGKVERDGGGAYITNRSMDGSGKMKVVGFLKPF